MAGGDNMAALDALNVQCRSLAKLVTELNTRLQASTGAHETRLLRLEQALGLAHGAPARVVAPARTAAPVVSVPGRAVRPGQASAPRAIDAPEPVAAPPVASPAAESADAAPDVLSVMSGLFSDFLTAVQHAGIGAQRKPSQPPPAPAPPAPAASSEDLGWLQAEGEPAPPAVEVTTTHVDHS